jgi:CBS domain-containing protein
VIYQTIGALLGDQQPVTLPPSATVLDAAREMAGRRVGAVAVTEGGDLVGLFTERDLLNRVVAAGKDPQTVSVAEVLTPQPVTIRDDQSLAAGLDVMFGNRFRHLPVVTREGTLVGVMSCRDVPASYVLMRERWQRARMGLDSAA